ncbi:MAG: lysine-sensitive aspartokinase 3 [Bacteroidetes bacterium]|nr:lysine-sensitive aspartokinase 3 [Bacteroidota bacterium]
MIVMKFGGTSVEDAKAMNNVISIIQKAQPQQPIVVLSAISGATTTFMKAASMSLDGQLDEAHARLNQLLERHIAIAENLIDDRPTIQQLILSFKRRFEELKNICHGIALLGELTNRSLDAIASIGERLSTLILAEAMEQRGLPVELVDARTFMITNDNFTAAMPLFDIVNEKVREIFPPLLQSGKIPLTQGFIGTTSKGITTTLGRGGSDYTASIIGASLGAKEIQIWTDVDGVLTADPRIVPNAQKLDTISFNEASELAYFGAKVLHPSTILPAIEKNIPVIVLNSKHPENTGTRIIAKPPSSNLTVKSIASKKGIIVINIISSRMLMAYGFLEMIFSIFNKYKTPVDLVSTSEVAVSLTIDNSTHLEQIVVELEQAAEVNVFTDKAIVCVIGERIRSISGIARRVFNALGDINVMMISQGASEINMSLVVNEVDVEETVKRLHSEFFEKQILEEKEKSLR